MAMAGMGSSLFDMALQGAQNTTKQEYNQRQMLFQNLVAAQSDSSWLMQHFPNFASWNSTGSGGGGYEAASNAPVAYAGTNYKPDTASAGKSESESAFYEYLRKKGGAASSGKTSSGINYTVG